MFATLLLDSLLRPSENMQVAKPHYSVLSTGLGRPFPGLQLLPLLPASTASIKLFPSLCLFLGHVHHPSYQKQPYKKQGMHA